MLVLGLLQGEVTLLRDRQCVFGLVVGLGFRAQGLDGVPPLRLEFHLHEVQVVLGMADRFCR